MQTAWDLGALLPGIGALLEDGTLTYAKARVVNDALELLGEPDKAAAEAMIADRLAGKTYGQVESIAARAAITVDPGLAERAREHAERNRARVVLKRERSGAASLLGCDLPSAETLAAHAATCARARVYQDSGAFPGVLTDQFRAMAYLDLMNEVSAEARIAAGPPDVGLGAPAEAAFRDEPEPGDPGAHAPEASGGSDCPCDECDGRCAPPADDGPADDGPDDHGPDDHGPADHDPDDDPGDDEPDGDEPGGDDGPHDDGTDGDPADDEPDGGEPCDGPGDGGPDGGGPGDSGAGDRGGCRACDGRCPPADDHDGPGPGPAGRRRATGPAPPPEPPPQPPPSPPPPPQPPQPPPQSRSPWSTPPGSPAPPGLTDLTVPLATLLGPPTRPGESHGFGPLDPALCRALAALAAASPHTTACVTVTDPDGHAIGHGCLTTGRRRAPLPGAPDPPLTALPARLNLTITATRLTRLLQPAGQSRPPGQPPPPGPASPTGWALTPPDAPRQPREATREPRPGTRASRPALVRHLDHHLAQRPAIPGPGRARPHPRLRPPPRITRLRAQRHAPPPGPDPRRRVHPADLLPPRQRQRLRARRPLRPRRPDLRLQRRSKKPRLPPGQTDTRLESHPAQTRLAPMGNTQRPHLHPRTQALPHC